MCEAPGSVVTLLCSGIQLYSAERRIADCILADVKRASMCTSAELARMSSSSEATITRLCHKLGFENYRKFQLALARDAMEQQETARRTREEGQDELRQALLDILANREEELRATIQAIDTRQLRRVLSLLRSCEVIEMASEGRGLPVALDASIRFSHLGKRCVASAIHEKTLAFAQTLTPKDLLMVFSASGRDAGLEEVVSAAKTKGAPVLHHLRQPQPAGPSGRLCDDDLQPRTAAHRGQPRGVPPLAEHPRGGAVLSAPDGESVKKAEPRADGPRLCCCFGVYFVVTSEEASLPGLSPFSNILIKSIGRFCAGFPEHGYHTLLAVDGALNDADADIVRPFFRFFRPDIVTNLTLGLITYQHTSD